MNTFISSPKDATFSDGHKGLELLEVKIDA